MRDRVAVRWSARLVALAVVLVALVVAPGAPSSGAEYGGGSLALASGSLDESTTNELHALMAARTSEVTDSGGAANAPGSIHHDAPAEVRQRRQWTIAGLRQLGVAEYSEELIEPVIDLTPPGSEGDGPGRRLVVATRRTYRIAGVDARPATETVFVEVGWTAGGWKVLHDDPLRSLGLTSDRGVWDVAPIDVRDEGSRVLIGAGASPARLAEVSTLLERAEDSLRSVDVVDPYLVVVPASAEQAASFLQSPLDLSKFVAFVTFSVDRDDGWDPGPPRLVLQEGNLARRGTQRQIEILAHELVHVAALRTAGPMTPLWVHEGFANWHVAGAVSAVGEGAAIPEGYAFRSGDLGDIVAAYDAAEALMARLGYLVGPDGPGRFFDGLGAVRSEPGTVIFHTEWELARLGVTREELEG